MQDNDAVNHKAWRPPGRVAAWVVPPDFIPDRVLDNQTWAEAIFEPAMLVAVTVCFVIGVIQLGLAFDPGWPTAFIAPLSVLVSVEAFLYSRRLTNSRSQLKEWLVLLAPVVVLERVLTLFADPKSDRAIDVALWFRNPASFFTLGFIADMVILLFTWVVVFNCTQYLNQLRVQYGEIADETNSRTAATSTNRPAESDDPGALPSVGRTLVMATTRDRFEDNWRAFDHSAPLRQLGQIYVTGGIILVILASLASIGSAQQFNLEALGQIIGFQRPSLHLVQVNVLTYFLCGLALLGECHFVRQRTLWRLDRISMPTNVPSRWVGSLAGLIACATLVAFVLPTSYAMTIGEIVTALAGLLAQIGFFVVGALFYIAYLISKLIPIGGSGKESAPPSQPPAIPPTAQPPSDTSPFEILRSIVFWVVVLAIVTYSLYVAWRRRPAWMSFGALDNLVGGLLRVLKGLVRLGRRAGEQMVKALATLPQRWRQQSIVVAPRFRFVSLSRLDPRQLIEYFYLSVCERATQLGHPRPPGATPDEFERVLRAEFPVVDPEIADLTAAFIEARYGPRPTTKEDVGRVRPNWQSLKQKLRRVRVSRLGHT